MRMCLGQPMIGRGKKKWAKYQFVRAWNLLGPKGRSGGRKEAVSFGIAGNARGRFLEGPTCCSGAVWAANRVPARVHLRGGTAFQRRRDAVRASLCAVLQRPKGSTVHSELETVYGTRHTVGIWRQMGLNRPIWSHLEPLFSAKHAHQSLSQLMYQ